MCAPPASAHVLRQAKLRSPRPPLQTMLPVVSQQLSPVRGLQPYLELATHCRESVPGRVDGKVAGRKEAAADTCSLSHQPLEMLQTC